MSSAIVASRALEAECGENATRASMPGKPRSVHFADGVSPNPFGGPCQYASNAARYAATGVAPWSTRALLF
jgi:hypothetical protein